MMNNKTKFISEISVLTSLTIVITLVLIIPLPSNSGYLNLSDAMIMIASNVTSPLGGFIVGALSGGICDLVAGYGAYIPFTIIIKGIEGYLAGYLFKKLNNKTLKYLSLFICGLLMGILYFIPDFIYYGVSVALLNLPLNILQGILGATIASLIILLIKKNKKALNN